MVTSVITRSTGEQVKVEYFGVIIRKNNQNILKVKLDDYKEAMEAFASTPAIDGVTAEFIAYYYDNGNAMTGELRKKILIRK